MTFRKKQSLYGLAIFGAIAAFGFSTNASAGCYFVSCPNKQPAPQYQGTPQQYAPQQSQTYTEQSYSSSSSQVDEYSEGYSIGYAAGKKSVSKSNSGNKKTYSSKSAKKPSKSKSAKISKPKAKKVTYAKKPVKKTTTYYSSSNSSYSYNGNAIQDSAKIYGANQYGPSINVATFAGRGETWVSSSYKIVSYSTPSAIQWVNGRQCGWGMPIASNGMTINSNTWVCHCETGWRPEKH